MKSKELLLKRLDEIAAALQKTPHAAALVGLGSSGTDQHRLDEYSDLDCFVVVRPGYKDRYLFDLQWLNSVCPIAYFFRNTPDSYKLFFHDGIFCELAVFEPSELETIPAPGAKILWKASSAENIKLTKPSAIEPEVQSTEWLVGEALTNLYVGLCRYHRGEKLSAMRFIQHYAVDRIIELVHNMQKFDPDPFAKERRFEKQFPEFIASMSAFLQGYERSRESALEILRFLDTHFQVNSFIKHQILMLAAERD